MLVCMVGRSRKGWPLLLFSVVASCGTHSGSRLPQPADASPMSTAAPPDGGTVADAGVDSSATWPPVIDPAAFGKTDLSHVTLAAFSQPLTPTDPQVLALVPDIVPRAWSQWDRGGLAAADYAFPYMRSCQAQGITFVGGLTASVLFMDEMSASDFDDDVGRDALDNQVPHPEITPRAYRGALASPGFRRFLIGIAELQIDNGVDGLFFDEVNSSYIGASFDGDEGFDDHDVADFGRYLCRTRGSDPGASSAFGFAPSDHFDCSSPDPGAAFDYRGYLARLGFSGTPLRAANPLSGAWGTTVQNRPNPSAGTFLETYPSLIYWQQIVTTVRNYARSQYGKEVLVTSNGIFPFVDFQSVGLYDYNPDGPPPLGFDYAPLVGTAPDVHFNGSVSFMPAFASLKAKSEAVTAFVGGSPVPVLLFLDWPTPSINRYYAMPTTERQDYIRVVLAEAYAYGEMFALPLATTTDSNTATALGMMDFFRSMRAFYGAHAALFHGARDMTTAVTVSAPSIASHVTMLADGRTLVHLVNHNYAAGFIAQSNVTVTLPRVQAPASVTLVSPDLPADQPGMFTFGAGQLVVTVGTVQSSVVVVVQ
jgi:hypothetical protein